MLTETVRKIGLVFILALFTFVYCPYSALGKSQRRYPCDPKFGYEGNYLEITTGDIAAAHDIQVCFGNEPEPRKPDTQKWWEFWKVEKPPLPVSRQDEVDACLSTSSLPGRYRTADGDWTAWQKRVGLDKQDTTFQFALCGSNEDLSVWEDFHRHHGVDSWDEMRIVAQNTGGILIKNLRVVQNRVRILDNEHRDEGRLDILLQDLSGGIGAIDLRERIKRSKLNRVNCLNLHSGAPYCEEGVPGLAGREELPEVLRTALLELGHSGSKKYGRENNSYCSEFALFVIEKAAGMSATCDKNIPNPDRENINVKDMFLWFYTCKRLIPRDEIKEKIKPGDFISVNNRLHSAFFMGWADPGKKFFWEISGNNKCQPEKETLYAPKNKANMVCISKRNFEEHVLENDYAGIVED